MVSFFWEGNDKEFLKYHTLQANFFKNIVGILIILFTLMITNRKMNPCFKFSFAPSRVSELYYI